LGLVCMADNGTLRRGSCPLQVSNLQCNTTFEPTFDMGARAQEGWPAMVTCVACEFQQAKAGDDW
jgi:hypothetical protein